MQEVCQTLLVHLKFIASEKFTVYGCSAGTVVIPTPLSPIVV